MTTLFTRTFLWDYFFEFIKLSVTLTAAGLSPDQQVELRQYIGLQYSYRKRKLNVFNFLNGKTISKTVLSWTMLEV